MFLYQPHKCLIECVCTFRLRDLQNRGQISQLKKLKCVFTIFEVSHVWYRNSKQAEMDMEGEEVLVDNIVTSNNFKRLDAI